MTTSQDFLKKLQQEAKIQSKLNDHKILPTQLDTLTNLVGNHFVLVVSLMAFFTALLIEKV